MSSFSALSKTQIAALYAVNEKQVRLTCESGTIERGPVALNTLWSLEERGLLAGHGRRRPRLSAWGKQVLHWIEQSGRYDGLLY